VVRSLAEYTPSATAILGDTRTSFLPAEQRPMPDIGRSAARRPGRHEFLSVEDHLKFDSVPLEMMLGGEEVEHVPARKHHKVPV
jgi:hypothetical protein